MRKVDELRDLLQVGNRISTLIDVKAYEAGKHPKPHNELKFETETIDDVVLEACVDVTDCNCAISKRTDRQSRSVFVLEPDDAVRFAHWILDVFGDS